MVFYVTQGDCVSFPECIARHMLTALAYDAEEAVRLGRLSLEDISARIAVVRQQFALGRVAEFTSAEMDQNHVLQCCDALESLVARAQVSRTDVSLL
jgi:hypothetical protein